MRKNILGGGGVTWLCVYVFFWGSQNFLGQDELMLIIVDFLIFSLWVILVGVQEILDFFFEYKS